MMGLVGRLRGLRRARNEGKASKREAMEAPVWVQEASEPTRNETVLLRSYTTWLAWRLKQEALSNGDDTKAFVVDDVREHIRQPRLVYELARVFTKQVEHMDPLQPELLQADIEAAGIQMLLRGGVQINSTDGRVLDNRKQSAAVLNYARSLAAGNVASILALLWALIIRYELDFLPPEVSWNERLTDMLDWVQDAIAGYELRLPSGKGAWTTGFKDGLVLCAVIHAYVPRLLEWEIWSSHKKSPSMRLHCVLSTAEKHLSVPRLIDHIEMSDTEKNDTHPRAVVTYVTLLRKALEKAAGPDRPGHGPEMSRIRNVSFIQYTELAYQLGKRQVSSLGSTILRGRGSSGNSSPNSTSSFLHINSPRLETGSRSDKL